MLLVRTREVSHDWSGPGKSHVIGQDQGSVLVVVNPSYGPCPCDQDVWLSVPPDIPDDALPLLQTTSLLQLLRRRKHVHAPHRACVAVLSQRADQDAGDVFLLTAVPLQALVLPSLLQLTPVGGGQCASTLAGLAGDAHHQETEGQEQARTHTHHEVEGQGFWVGWEGIDG